MTGQVVGIRPLWTPAQIHQLFARIPDRAQVATRILLARAGEEFVTMARSIQTYKDRTGNLRSSTGYAILQDGVAVQAIVTDANVGEQDKRDGRTGVETSHRLIRELSTTYPKGLVLILMAGMSYAAAVEARGYDVITHSAERSSDYLIEEAKHLLEKLSLNG